MKRLIIAILLLTAIVGGCIYNFYYLGKTVDELAVFIVQADAAAQSGDFKTAGKLLEKSFSTWKEKENPLGALIRHQEMDDIHNLYIRTIKSAAFGDAPEYFMQSGELVSMLRHLVEIETPTVKNIF